MGGVRVRPVADENCHTAVLCTPHDRRCALVSVYANPVSCRDRPDRWCADLRPGREAV